MSQSDHAATSDKIRKKIVQAGRLAAMPHVVWQLVEALSDERTSASNLEEFIASDQALASKLLSLANSAYYSLRQKVTSIKQAVVIIGFDELHVLALGTGLAEVFDLRRAPAWLDAEGLWQHTLSVSWLARHLARFTNQVSPGEALVGGLMHDLGKLLMATHLREEYHEVFRLVEEGIPYYQAEEAVGLDHCRVGYMLAVKWDLPEVHREVIRDHHRPRKESPFYPTVALVTIANILAKTLGLGVVHPAPAVDLRGLTEDMGLDSEALRTVAKGAQEQLPKILQRWSGVLDRGGDFVTHS